MDIIKSENKLQELGFVNLSPEMQHKLNHQHQHYIAWRAVWKKSVSTPCRIVFDASRPTSSGFSLNDILAKGRNNLNKLQEIVIRWFTHKFAITTDIRKMYNTIHLDKDEWCYQRNLWQTDLNPLEPPQDKVIKTLIYGVRSSGNQTEQGLRKIARLSRYQYPKACEAVEDDTYVDDCATGEEDKQAAITLSEETELVVNQGGFNLKGELPLPEKIPLNR